MTQQYCRSDKINIKGICTILDSQEVSVFNNGALALFLPETPRVQIHHYLRTFKIGSIRVIRDAISLARRAFSTVESSEESMALLMFYQDPWSKKDTSFKELELGNKKYFCQR